MNILHMLGLDTNEIYGGGLILIGVFFFVFAYIHWRINEAWKKNEGEKTKFTEIWKPGTLIGVALFLLIGLGFWFLDDLLAAFRPI